jgi:hypothetical protein
VIADWDGDGRWDILTGSADGGVYWYRNVGKRGEPRFEPPVALVAPHKGVGYNELLDSTQLPKPGIRSQIAVVDYDGDGKLDILVGDFCTNLHVKKDLTPEQRRAFEATRDREAKAGEKLGKLMKALHARWDTLMKDVPKADWHTKENSARWQKMYQEVRQSKEYQQHNAEYEKANKDMKQYVDVGPRAYDAATPHGYVWLFRRK